MVFTSLYMVIPNSNGLSDLAIPRERLWLLNIHENMQQSKCHICHTVDRENIKDNIPAAVRTLSK